MSLRYRHEFKYTVDAATAHLIEERVRRHGMMKDPMTPTGEDYYYVNSLYFDTEQFDCYYDKMGGLLQRKKVRLRTYTADFSKAEKYWLEVKHKFDTQTAKNREGLSAEATKRLLAGSTEVIRTLKDPMIRQSFYEMHVQPWLLVRYKRRAYTDLFDNVRVTFDYDLGTAEVRGMHHPSSLWPVNGQQVLIEVKFREACPGWIHELIQMNNLQRMTHSKYTLCADRVRMYLPFAI